MRKFKVYLKKPGRTEFEDFITTPGNETICWNDVWGEMAKRHGRDTDVTGISEVSPDYNPKAQIHKGDKVRYTKDGVTKTATCTGWGFYADAILPKYGLVGQNMIKLDNGDRIYPGIATKA